MTLKFRSTNAQAGNQVQFFPFPTQKLSKPEIGPSGSPTLLHQNSRSTSQTFLQSYSKSAPTISSLRACSPVSVAPSNVHIRPLLFSNQQLFFPGTSHGRGAAPREPLSPTKWPWCVHQWLQRGVLSYRRRPAGLLPGSRGASCRGVCKISSRRHTALSARLSAPLRRPAPHIQHSGGTGAAISCVRRHL